MRPQHNLNALFLMYAGQLAAFEHNKALADIGFRTDQIRRLKEINLEDLGDLATALDGRLVEARIDPDAFDILLGILFRKRSEREKILRLIKAGASFQIMHTLTGMDSGLYSAYRKVVGLGGCLGGRRRLDIDDAEEAARFKAICRAWQSTEGLDELDRLLAVHELTGQSIQVIYWAVRTEEIRARPYEPKPSPIPTPATGTGAAHE
jgi:hypothetical protein